MGTYILYGSIAACIIVVIFAILGIARGKVKNPPSAADLNTAVGANFVAMGDPTSAVPYFGLAAQTTAEEQKDDAKKGETTEAK